jgi:hypothetical protein
MNRIPSNTKEMPPAPIIRPKTSKDARLMAAFMVVIAVYLVIALALPLYAMLSKSFTTAAFDLDNFEFQVNTGDGWSEVISASQINETLKLLKPEELKTNVDGRLYATPFSLISVSAAKPNIASGNWMKTDRFSWDPHVWQTPTGTPIKQTSSDASSCVLLSPQDWITTSLIFPLPRFFVPLKIHFSFQY